MNKWTDDFDYDWWDALDDYSLDEHSVDDEDAADDGEIQECYTCRGTGEGMYDGARCGVCKGRGY